MGDESQKFGGTSPSSQRPNVFDYLNYRNFVRDTIEYLRSKGEYSNRKFASEVGFKSPSFLRMIIQGERNLSRENLEKLSKAFQLDPKENEFFELLVEFDQAPDMKSADLVYKRILSNEAFRKVRRMAQAEYDFFSNWHLMAILEGINSDFGQLPESRMAEIVGLSLEEVKKNLEILRSLELIELKNGRWVRKDRQLETALDIQSLNIRNFHRQMAMKAIEVMDTMSSDERTFAAMTINLSEEGYQDFRKRIFDFLRDSNAIYSESDKSDVVYQLNIQLFPLIKLKTQSK